jgi:TPR repeat protein
VEISDATPNATIHYTVDGSPPTKDSPIYNHPMTSLPSGAVVRAMATADDYTPSADITGVYIWSGAAQPAVSGSGGSTYDQGKSSYDHKQYAQARTLFGRACDGGEMRACNYLGYLYAQGLGGPQSVQTAREVYQKACDKGTLSSCASLGSLYQDAGNSEEARKYFQKACNGGLAAGCDLLRGVQ